MRPAMAFLPLLFASTVLHWSSSESVPACDSPVFCYGPLLATIQNASIFNDSKEFVDRPLVADQFTVLEAFVNLSDPTNVTLLRQFVEKWTLSAGSDLMTWEPPDWVERPPFVDSIKDNDLRQWALDLNSIWKQLGRQVNSSVSQYPDRHSLLYLPHPFIVPGGRFRETYYWDTYWILEGLLLCQMNDTARGMIENLAYLVDQYGLVPNGGRAYYIRRSQPPLLTQMVDLYYNRTGNRTFLQDMLPTLVREYEFWMENRMVEVKSHTLNRYDAPTTGPRPESFEEDIKTAEKVAEDERPSLYMNLASAAESGWDFSTRWFSRSDSHVGQLSTIRTSQVVPVDLNAILCQNEATLERLFRAVGNSSEADYFRNAALKRQAAFHVFWNEADNLWKDWDLETGSHLKGAFYASSLSPLAWTCGSGDTEQQEKVLSTLNSLGVLDYPGGVPSSLETNSTQQWDFPNVWAPLEWLLVASWHDSPSAELREAARKVAQTWLTTTYLAWKNYNRTMFEKYNCTKAGEPGGGGEYQIQAGFGWTNGVVLHLLSLYPDMVIPDSSTHHTEQNLGWISVIVLTIVTVAILIPCVLWCRWMYIRGRDQYWGRVRNEHLIAAQGGLSHSRPQSRPHSPTTYVNMYADSVSPDTNDELMLEHDV